VTDMFVKHKEADKTSAFLSEVTFDSGNMLNYIELAIHLNERLHVQENMNRKNTLIPLYVIYLLYTSRRHKMREQ